MGFGSLFGSIGRAIKRPFKDIHKAVTKVGGGVHAFWRGMTGGGFKKRKDSPLTEHAGKGAFGGITERLRGKAMGREGTSGSTKSTNLPIKKKKKKSLMPQSTVNTGINMTSGSRVQPDRPNMERSSGKGYYSNRKEHSQRTM